VARLRFDPPSSLCLVPILAGLSALILSGCASFQGAPQPITPGTAVADACPRDTDITAFNAASAGPGGSTKRQWRDTIIAGCIEQVDGRYSEFVNGLHEQSVSVNLGLDLAALALTSGAAIASKTAANALSAASTGVIGANAAFNKDIFYQKTLPAIVAQMVASRADAYKDIRTSEQSDETVYTLVDAQHDIRNYEFAGTIDGAIAKITAAAQQSTDASNNTVQALFVAEIVDAPAQTRKAKLAQYVKSLTQPADKAKLDQIAAALKVTVAAGADVATERYDVIVQLDKQIVDKPSMDTVAALMKPIANQDF
jgi:hypothetical protein